MHVLNLLVLLACISSIYTASVCQCKNNGKCDSKGESCVCTPGYYGLICSNYASSYKIQYFSTPVDVPQVLAKLKSELAKYRIVNASRLDPGNIVKLTFHMNLKPVDLVEIEKGAIRVGGSAKGLVDFNECLEGNQVCYSNAQCVNTEGSFQCGCPSGYFVDNAKCEKSNDNTKTVIYVWSGAVCALVLFMIGFIVYIRWRKNENQKKEDKFMQQHERKLRANGTLNSTNLREYDVPTFRRSSPGSVFGDSIASNRPFSMHGGPGDASSLYSYSSRQYATSEPDLHRNRLSIPVLESYPAGYVNQGYGDDTRKISRTSGYDISPTDRYSYPSGIPTTFLPESNDTEPEEETKPVESKPEEVNDEPEQININM